MAKDSRFAREYLKKLQSDSKLNEGVSTRKRKLELSWLKQEGEKIQISMLPKKNNVPNLMRTILGQRTPLP